MKRLLLPLIPVILLSGCIVEEDRTSALDPIRQEDNQTRHYRPVNIDNPAWSMDELGKTITLKTGKNQVKISARYTSGQPNVIMREDIYDTMTHILPDWNQLYTVIRTDGNITGYVQSGTDTVEVYTTLSSDLSPNQNNHIIFQCDIPKQIASVITPFKTIHYSIQTDEVSSHMLKVKKQHGRRLYSVINTANTADNITYQGKTLESPFNLIGTIIFHTDEIPLPERTGLAWYLTVTHTDCMRRALNK